MMNRLRWIKHLCEYLGGAQDVSPNSFFMPPGSLNWGLWWGLLAAVIVAFCGQSSKFIYIDF